MKILSSYNDGTLRIILNGELDHHEAKETARVSEQLIDDYMPRSCIIDMKGLSFMDSSGIAVILRIYRKMCVMNGRACVENAGNQPLKVLDASGIDRLVKIVSAKETVK